MPRKMSKLSAGEKLLAMFIKLMGDGRPHFQTDLANCYECSPQAIGEMAKTIENLPGVNLIKGLDNRRRYYQIKTLSSRARPPLDVEEVRYLCLCRDLAGPVLPEPVAKRIDETILSLSMWMADKSYEVRAQAQQSQLTFFAKGRIDYTPHLETITKLTQATRQKLICRVKYKAAGQDSVKEHRLAPGSIISQNNALYVLGAGLNAANERRHLTNLAIHRIAEVIVTKKNFDFDLPEANPGDFGLRWHEPKTFRIRFKAGKATDYVRERTWAENQRLEESPDGSLTLEITTSSEPELLAWVRSFGDEARLESCQC